MGNRLWGDTNPSRRPLFTFSVFSGDASLTTASEPSSGEPLFRCWEKGFGMNGMKEHDWVNNISMLRKHDLRLDTSIVIAWPPYMTSLYIQSQRGTCTWTPRQALCMGDCCKASPSEFVGCWKGRVYDAVMPLLPCFAQQLARMEPDTHGGGGFGMPGLPGKHWSWYTMIELHSKEASLGRRARGRGSERWGGTISDDSLNFKQES